MTREEAIKMIKAIKNGLHETGKDFPYRDEIIPIAKEALEMAIKALSSTEKQKPCTDAVSRKYLLSKARGGDWNGGGFSKEYVYIEDIENAPPIILVDNK